MEAIKVEKLERKFKVHERAPGFAAAVKSLFKRKFITVKAVKKISFSIKQGEIVGFLGPNGAGKSTTIKMLTSVLYPTSGKVSVLGYTPWEERTKYVQHIGAVFGQKSQLWWDLPPIDAFHLAKGIFKIPEDEFKKRLDELVKMLKVSKIMKRPARELSLGERMKCEFIMALLHNPKVLFLDEPTIGVDAISKEEIRDFLADLNKKYNTTIILTTHDMDDIEELCERVIIIDVGQIIYDGDLETVMKKYVKWKTVDFEFVKIKNEKKFKELMKKGIVQEERRHLRSVRFNRKKVDVPNTIEQLMKCCQIVDLTVHEPRLEHVIKEIYLTKGKK